MNLSGLIPTYSLVAVLFLATVHDILYQRIPNFLTLTTMVVSLFYYSTLHGLSGFFFSLGGMCVGIALMLLPYLFRGMGAGDVKLMGAVGGILGPSGVLWAFLFTGLVGGLYALLLLIYSGNFATSMRRYALIAKTFLASRQFIYFAPSTEIEKLRLRYGIPIAVGTLLSIVFGNNIDNLFI
jgi:prepilin peptidase CpaA